MAPLRWLIARSAEPKKQRPLSTGAYGQKKTLWITERMVGLSPRAHIGLKTAGGKREWHASLVPMGEEHKAISVALAQLVVPELRSRGFTGSMPHFRRNARGAIELLTFQFDKYGGGFVFEISRCSERGFTTHWGKHISANKVTAHDLHPHQRKRIKPREGSGIDAWFRYDTGLFKSAESRASAAAREVLKCLPEAESWWEHESQRIRLDRASLSEPRSEPFVGRARRIVREGLG
jgi:hypothetical protein